MTKLDSIQLRDTVSQQGIEIQMIIICLNYHLIIESIWKIHDKYIRPNYKLLKNLNRFVFLFVSSVEWGNTYQQINCSALSMYIRVAFNKSFNIFAFYKQQQRGLSEHIYKTHLFS